jgi:UDP-sugar transporter A1/2/3
MIPIIAFTALALLLPCQIHGDSPLVPSNRLLNERGGAVIVKKSSWRRSHTPDIAPHIIVAETTATEYFLEPVQKYVRSKYYGLATAPKTSVGLQNKADGLTPTAIICMSLLALQFGVQPLLVRKFTPQTIVRSSVVLVQELVKFGIAGALYYSGTKAETREIDFNGWSVKTWITLAGLPAFLYTIQNVATLMAQQNLEALTFNVLNQSKILSAALSCYFVMGKRQSNIQMISLCILMLSTLVIEQILKPSTILSIARGGVITFGGKSSTGTRHFTHGVVPLMVASLLSGMAGALTQSSTQGSQGGMPIWGKRRGSNAKPTATRPPRNAYLFSMELSVASVILLLVSLILSSDGRSIILSPRTFFSNWTPETLIPVLTNSIGGILVGLVTKHAGSVRKGFALIFGLLLSGLLQASGAGIQAHQIVGGLLAAASLWMHTIG